MVGIIRVKSELEDALIKIADIRKRAANISVAGGKAFNPGFHLTIDLDNMLMLAEAIAKCAVSREESRGGHTRDDFPKMDSKWRQINHITSWNGSAIELKQQKLPFMPQELYSLFDPEELKKYLSEEEMAIVKGGNH